MGALNIGMIAPIIGGGIRTQLNNVIPLLQEKGHYMTVLTSNAYELDNFDVIHVKSLRFPSKLYAFMPALIKVIGNVAEKWDIIHIHGYPCYPADLLTVFHFLHKTPIVITLHGSFHQYTSHMNLFAKKIHNSLMVKFAGCVDKFVAVSHAEKDIVIQSGVPKKKLVVIYNGVNARYFKAKKNDYLRSAFGDGKYIVYLGRLASSKNLDMLLTALSYVTRTEERAKLMLLGPDWGERDKLEKLARKLMIKNSVFFLGGVTENEKTKILSSADVFVHPSTQDIFALTILEASASALPVVAFDMRGNREMVIDGKTGLLVKEITAEALADAIGIILGYNKKARNFGESGRKYISENFSWIKTSDLLENVYLNVV